MSGQQSGAEHTQTPPELASFRATIARLPVTIRPIPSQQLSNWELLFPYEQKQLRRFLQGIDAFSPAELEQLTGVLRSLERKMGVAQWRFSETTETMENGAQLARSAWYPEWRQEVQRIFAAIDVRTPPDAEMKVRRLIVLVLPQSLPVSPGGAWRWWQNEGTTVTLSGDTRSFCDLLFSNRTGSSGKQGDANPADFWWIETDETPGGGFEIDSRLSYSALKSFREKFLAQLNTTPKDMTTADEIMAKLRNTDWTPWCPHNLSGNTVLRHFVIELFLSGNGALNFPSAFVEWAASEALRRARPRTVVARFGMRSKPRPFTSIAIFENQEKVSTLPEVDDPENSAIDAAILARYTWLAARRYPEYEQALCLCIYERLNAVRVIAPPGSGLEISESMAPNQLAGEVGQWLSA